MVAFVRVNLKPIWTIFSRSAMSTQIISSLKSPSTTSINYTRTKPARLMNIQFHQRLKPIPAIMTCIHIPSIPQPFRYFLTFPLHLIKILKDSNQWSGRWSRFNVFRNVKQSTSASWLPMLKLLRRNFRLVLYITPITKRLSTETLYKITSLYSVNMLSQRLDLQYHRKDISSTSLRALIHPSLRRSLMPSLLNMFDLYAMELCT